ncbi:MAG TPA: beta-N-acetylhexosaminidase [Micromonosporaceae bacterium]|nr:beta-N-acetylhexosaminidase [Micromonosporaceae bacterium]
MDIPPGVEAAATAGIPRPRPAPPPATSRLTELVPAPVAARSTDLTYTLPADATIQADPGAMQVAGYLADLLRRCTGYPLPIVPAAPDAPTGDILLLLGGADPRVGPEGYELDVTATGVTLRARAAAGLFYGVQTLRQLLPPAVESDMTQPGPWTMPGGHLLDHPRFPYRGAMLDVSRHFFPVADVKRYLDELALYKINHLHLHLTDDQGWRIVIDSWPRLAEIGGASEVGGGPGGHYTKQQYREIVEYAAARHITIVPEIDMPGHTNAALVAYPELAPDGVTPTPYTDTDVGFSALAVHRDATYAFITDVLGEIAALTPGPYLHIGGDEAWTLNPADYATFMNRLQPIVTATGKTVMGWHQLAVADHTDGRIIQFWGTSPEEATVAEAVRQRARVVLSPGNRTYLDMKYSPETPLGKDWAGLVEVRQAYDWDPAAYLADVPATAVLGVEAPLWTETITTMGQIEYMTFPRLPAIAELGWSPASTHDWADFRRRLATHAPRWIAAGIAFHPSPEVPWAHPEPAPAVGDPTPPVSEPSATAGEAGTVTRTIGPAHELASPPAAGTPGSASEDLPLAPG